MPFVKNLSRAGVRPHRQRDATVVEDHGRLGLLVTKGQEVAPPPKIVRFAGYKLPWRFAGLPAQSRLLIAYPAKSGNGVGESGRKRSQDRVACFLHLRDLVYLHPGAASASAVVFV
jgi:hypothetical protein